MFLPFSYIPYVLGGVLMKFLCYLSKKKKKSLLFYYDSAIIL